MLNIGIDNNYELKVGDYVYYNFGYGEDELGRVASFDKENNKVFVCFHAGCTASCCNPKFVRKVNKEDLIEPIPHFGYYRFDDDCPNYDPDVCCIYCIDKNKNKNS